MAENVSGESKLMELYRREAEVVSLSQKTELYPMALERGRGALLWDMDGKEYIDFSSGDCVANIGYSHPYLVQAVSEQMGMLNHSLSVRHASETNAKLALRLAELTPVSGATKVLFALSGTDACEAAYKLVRAYTGRPRVLSHMGSVHGFALGTLSMSGFRGFSQFLTLSDGTKVPYPYCYRCPMGLRRGECGVQCLRYVEDYVFKTVCDPEQVAAWIVEAVQGDGGYIVPPKEYMEGVERICRKWGMLLVADEVLLGFGRTGQFYSFENFALQPDLVVVGKAIGGGIPLGAVIGRPEIVDALPGKHTSTTGGSLLGTAAGLATLNAIRDEGLVAQAGEMGGYLHSLLEAAKSRHACMGDVRGIGMGMGIEIVDARDGSTAPDLALEIARGALRNGLLMSVFGIDFNVLMIAPPLVLSREQAEEGVERLERAMSQVE